MAGAPPRPHPRPAPWPELHLAPIHGRDGEEKRRGGGRRCPKRMRTAVGRRSEVANGAPDKEGWGADGSHRGRRGRWWPADPVGGGGGRLEHLGVLGTGAGELGIHAQSLERAAD
jgi:hypothetical protein